jgi:hypothetical protein
MHQLGTNTFFMYTKYITAHACVCTYLQHETFGVQTSHVSDSENVFLVLVEYKSAHT